MTRADGDPEDILVINEMPDEVVSEDEADETHVSLRHVRSIVQSLAFP